MDRDAFLADQYGACFRAIDTLKMIRTIDIKELQDKVIAQLIEEAKDEQG